MAPTRELAFAGLCATATASGWLEGNRPPARVSGKLGYRGVRVSEVRPRGLPVEIAGLAPALALFGA